MVGFHFSVLALGVVTPGRLEAFNLFIRKFIVVRYQQAAGAVFGEHGDGIAVDEVELGAGTVALVGLAFLEGVDEGVLGLGVFGEDVGEAVAALVVVAGVAGRAVVDADPAGVLAVEGLGFGAFLFGEEVGDDALGAGFVGAWVGGERGLVGGAEAVALAFGLGFALAGAGVVDAGELAVGVAAVGAVGDGGFFGGRGEGGAEGPGEGLLDGGGHLGVVGEEVGEAHGEGLGRRRRRLRQERPQGLGKGGAVGVQGLGEGAEPAVRGGGAVGDG